MHHSGLQALLVSVKQAAFTKQAKPSWLKLCACPCVHDKQLFMSWAHGMHGPASRVVTHCQTMHECMLTPMLAVCLYSPWFQGFTWHVCACMQWYCCPSSCETSTHDPHVLNRSSFTQFHPRSCELDGPGEIELGTPSPYRDRGSGLGIQSQPHCLSLWREDRAWTTICSSQTRPSRPLCIIIPIICTAVPAVCSASPGPVASTHHSMLNRGSTAASLAEVWMHQPGSPPHALRTGPPAGPTCLHCSIFLHVLGMQYVSGRWCAVQAWNGQPCHRSVFLCHALCPLPCSTAGRQSW